MYGHVLGGSTVAGAGAVLLPNTGGNALLTVAAVMGMTVGGAILLSTVVLAVTKKAAKA